MERAGGRERLDELDIAVRAWAVREETEGKDEKSVGPRGGGGRRVPERFLIVDTETTVDETQRLLFGCWRYYRTRPVENGVELIWLAEGLFHPDDLHDWYPGGYAALQQFDGRSIRTDPDEIDANRRLPVQTQTEFLNSVLWRATYQARAGVVCFNWPFDVSRLAHRAGEARNRSGDNVTVVDGGFSLLLWPYQVDGETKQSRYRPSIAIKSLDSKRAFKRFKGPDRIDFIDRIPEGEHEPNEDWKFRGNFLDLRTLVFSLTDRGHTLESACKAFGVPYKKRPVEQGVIRPENIEYCREDVEATARLCEASVNEFLRHPVSLQATRAYSPATLGRSYLKTMRVTPPRQRQELDPRLMGWSMSAYYGGRAECRIRKTPVPVVYLDFLSMYPTVCRLLGIWKLLTSHMEIERAKNDVQALLEDLTIDKCFDPELWPQLVGIAQINPGGDVLPVRARYGETMSWQIGLNPLHADEPMWFTLADLAASKLLTGKTPTIKRAIRLRPTEQPLPGLRPVRLLGEVEIDPRDRRRDFFQEIVEERKRAEARDGKKSPRARGLKVLANATSYGIYAQMTRHSLPGNQKAAITVYGYRNKPMGRHIPTPEDPGEYTFPPIAAAITGGARLMLALLERRVTQAGGTYAFCDTDSMAIVATQQGGIVHHPSDRTPEVRALSEHQIEEIRNEFNQLNQYSDAPGTESLLELEDENFVDPESRRNRRQLYCYAISAKRYVLYNHDEQGRPVLRAYTAVDEEGETPDDHEPAIRKASEHGLGHLLNPTDPKSADRDWIAQIWQHILRTHEAGPPEEPSWFTRTAVARSTISTPIIWRQFAKLNQTADQRWKPYAEQIKPFNFFIAAFVEKQERPDDEQRMVLISPYETTPATIKNATWTNRYSGRRYKLMDEPSRGREIPEQVYAKTYGDIVEEYLGHQENKSLAPDGGPCEPYTAGLLQRRAVKARSITHIGKEANQLEDTQTQLIADQDEILNQYDDPEQHYYQHGALPILRQLGPREVARRTGYSLGAVHAALAGKSMPRRKHRTRYIEIADDHLGQDR